MIIFFSFSASVQRFMESLFSAIVKSTVRIFCWVGGTFCSEDDFWAHALGLCGARDWAWASCKVCKVLNNYMKSSLRKFRFVHWEGKVLMCFLYFLLKTTFLYLKFQLHLLKLPRKCRKFPALLMACVLGTFLFFNGTLTIIFVYPHFLCCCSAWGMHFTCGADTHTLVWMLTGLTLACSTGDLKQQCH